MRVPHRFRPPGLAAMPMLPARHYESEHTRFIREMKAMKPQLETEQRKSRAIWWDKRPKDLAETRKMDAGRVPQTAYVYQVED
jgi:uncharacterized protein DUF3460